MPLAGGRGPVRCAVCPAAPSAAVAPEPAGSSGRPLGGAGKVSSNSLPEPGLLRTVTSPPCARATARTRGSPRPVPRDSWSSPVRNRSKMRCSRSSGMPLPPSATMMRTGMPGQPLMTDNCMTLPVTVCRTAFSRSASRARPSRSLSARTVTGSSRPSCQLRSAVGRHRLISSMISRSSATTSACRNPGSPAAAMRSSRSAILRSRLSSPITTWMSWPCCWPVRSPASSSAWPSAIVIGVRSWCAASWRNRRWVGEQPAVLLAEQTGSPGRPPACGGRATPWRRTPRPSAAPRSAPRAAQSRATRRGRCRRRWSA